MEKEQKKLLLVAVSVGVFLLVTVTVAIIFISPGAQLQEPAISSTVPYIPNPSQPVIHNTQETIINIGNQDAEIIDRDNGDSLTIHIPVPSAASVSVIPVEEEIRQNTPAAVRPAPAPAPAATTPVTTTPAATASTQQTTQSAAPPRTTTTRTITDYWIQTNAYTAIIPAEDQKESLASKGLVSIIDISEVSGRVMYRVWMGPYTSRAEADYWLAILKQVDGFRDEQLGPDQRPYIRQTSRQI